MSSSTNLDGRAARAFASSLGCEQMVTESTHIDGGVLDLVLTDVSDDVRVRVGSTAEPQIIVPFYRCSAGATYSSLDAQAGGLSQELCGLGPGERRCEGS